MDIRERKAITDKIDRNQPVTFDFQFAAPKLLMIINSIVAKYLAKMDYLFLMNSVVTILREVIVNALKANAKRVFFVKKGYDLKKRDSYEKGMADFKEQVIGDFDSIESDMLSSDYYVKITFSPDETALKVTVENNSAIHPTELDRINFRIEKALKYNDFSEAYAEVDDDSEGAGLGIVLTILFLKSMGIDPRTFTITTNGKTTTTTLVIPRQLLESSISTRIKGEIVNKIDGVPTFPENIMRLIQMCDNPETAIESLSATIMLDPAITIDVIKLSNSAGFITGKRIETVPSAVMTIGIKNVKSILMASNARKIMNERFSNYEQIWEHCNKVAAYARFIASFCKKNNVSENAFTAGLLHDLGKIILLSTDVKLVKSISEIVKNRKMASSTMMEEISIGVSHSEIGGLVALKWQFPDYLIDAISCHHAPQSANPDNYDLVYVVYLANLYVGIEDRKYTYYHADEMVLEHLGIETEDAFKQLHDKLKKKYENVEK